MKRIIFFFFISLLTFTPCCLSAAADSQPKTELTRQVITPLIKNAKSFEDLLKAIKEIGIDNPGTFLTEKKENLMHFLALAKDLNPDIIKQFAQYLSENGVDINLSVENTPPNPSFTPLSLSFNYKNWTLFEWLINNETIDVNKEFFAGCSKENKLPFLNYALEILFTKKEGVYREKLINFIDVNKNTLNFTKAPIINKKDDGTIKFGPTPFARIIFMEDIELFEKFLNLHKEGKNIALDISFKNGYQADVIGMIMIYLHKEINTKKHMFKILIEEFNAFTDPEFNQTGKTNLLMEMLKIKFNQDLIDQQTGAKELSLSNEIFKELLNFVYQTAVKNGQLYPFYSLTTDKAQYNPRYYFNNSMLMIYYLFIDDYDDDEISGLIKDISQEILKHFPKDDISLSPEEIHQKYQELFYTLFSPFTYKIFVYNKKNISGEDSFDRLLTRLEKIIKQAFPYITELRFEKNIMKEDPKFPPVPFISSIEMTITINMKELKFKAKL